MMNSCIVIFFKFILYTNRENWIKYKNLVHIFKRVLNVFFRALKSLLYLSLLVLLLLYVFILFYNWSLLLNCKTLIFLYIDTMSYGKKKSNINSTGSTINKNRGLRLVYNTLYYPRARSIKTSRTRIRRRNSCVFNVR